MSDSTPATIEDVARIAEVSIATVSRAIHNPEKVAKSTRLKVNQAIAITGYTTNAMARSLRLGRSNMIPLSLLISAIRTFLVFWSASKTRHGRTATAC